MPLHATRTPSAIKFTSYYNYYQAFSVNSGKKVQVYFKDRCTCESWWRFQKQRIGKQKVAEKSDIKIHIFKNLKKKKTNDNK